MSSFRYSNPRVFFQGREGNFFEQHTDHLHVVITREESEEWSRHLIDQYRDLAQSITTTYNCFVFDYSHLVDIEGQPLFAPDTLAYDARPEYCWRCDIVPAFNDLGLCQHCHTILTKGKTA